MSASVVRSTPWRYRRSRAAATNRSLLPGRALGGTSPTVVESVISLSSIDSGTPRVYVSYLTNSSRSCTVIRMALETTVEDEMVSRTPMGRRPVSGSGPMIEVEGVRKSFGTTVALDGVDLRAEAGRVLALLGPNGAGKTTLVRILTTLLAPDSGHASVGGYDTVRRAAPVRSATGLTGEHAARGERLSGRE